MKKKIILNGQPIDVGRNGKDATINGENTLQIVAGDNVQIEQQNSTLTISAQTDLSGVDFITEEQVDEKIENAVQSVDTKISNAVANKVTSAAVSEIILTTEAGYESSTKAATTLYLIPEE